MKKITGLELVTDTADILTENDRVQQYVSKHRLDYYQFGIIVLDENDRLQLASLLNEYNVFETEFTLYKLEKPEKKRTFIDFGFLSNEKNYYLYAELVIPFTISGHNEKNVHTALEQMDEHLIAIDETPERTQYYVERYHQQLIEGIADAYRVIVTFYP
jgi:pyruvate/2-oxoacid:ferredoxin oxidoreductase alpha subunit